jgi:hypothetical protein
VELACAPRSRRCAWTGKRARDRLIQCAPNVPHRIVSAGTP